MKTLFRAGSAIALASLMTACATPSYYSPVEVTRFSGTPGVAVARGPIGVQAAPGADASDATYTAFQAAVAEQLSAMGFQLTGGAAPYTALVEVDRSVIAAGARQGPVSVGGGASTGGYGSGVGLGLGLNLSPPDPDEIDTQLSVSIRPSGGGDAVWEGRARFTATTNNEYADLTASARRVSEALFRGFPGNSGETIEVE